MQLRGCGTALVTPFRQDGAIDDTALRNLIAWQIESGVDFLVPCGTTGETPTLTHDEWLYVIDVAIELAAGRVPIVAGATSNSTHEAVVKAKEAAARPGVNAILTASPYYNKPTQEGQYRHFRTIAESIEKPIILYNVPGRTGANIEPGTFYLLQRRGAVERAVSDVDIFEAKSVPPQTTRARLRGELIRRAQEPRRDFTVDWVHRELNDQAQRTVLCKDPFRCTDERVEKLIAGM